MVKKIKKQGTFNEFFWGAIRAVHPECPFMELARLAEATIVPKMLNQYPTNGAIPFFAELPRYFDEQTLRIEMKSVQGLELTRINGDLPRNRTLIMGLSFDQLINSVFTKEVFKRTTTGNVYTQMNFEVLPVISPNREDLFSAEKIVSEEAKKRGGEAYLDTIGRVSSLRDLWHLQEAFSPQPETVPGLSVMESKILEAAIAYGYYEVPRKIILEDLAKKMGMTKPTLSRKLRNIENRIVNNTLFQPGINQTREY